MDLFGITLEISSSEILESGENKIGSAMSVHLKHESREDVREKAVIRLLQEIVWLVEKCIKRRLYTHKSFFDIFDKSYQDYSFSNSSDTEEKIKTLALEVFKDLADLKIIKCEAKKFQRRPEPIEIGE